MNATDERPPTDDWEPVTGRVEIADRIEIADIELAERVTHPTRGRILRRLKRPHSAAELADWLDVPVTRLYHHLKLLESADLIHVAATRKVGAATERRYQASGKSFQIAESILEQSAPAQLAPLLGSLFDLAKLDLVEFVESEELDPPTVEQQLLIGYAQKQLTPPRRAELIARLTTVLKDFEDNAGGEDTETFAVFIAAFPPN